MSDRKLALIVVDSMRTDMLKAAVRRGQAPTFAELLRRGRLIPDCVSSFPSVTPVCCAEIVTGATPREHWVSGMNWYHRTERRYVEYGTSLDATRAFGLFRALYDVVYNMNMAHLSHEVETVFERLGDRGLRTACTPFLIYRGRSRHELSLEGMMRRVAVAASFRHAVWGPDELFYGELYASRRVPCRPTRARPGTRDAYSACVGRELLRADLYDFLLFSLPDNDHHSHRLGPDAMPGSIAGADAALAELVDEGGGIDRFLDTHAAVVMADHAQTSVEHPLPLADVLERESRVLRPNAERPELAELAVSPTGRAAGVYVLAQDGRGIGLHAKVRRRLCETDGVGAVAWLRAGEEPWLRSEPSPPDEGAEAAVRTARGELRWRPGSQTTDRRGRGWDVDGDLGTLELTSRDGRLDSDRYPDALARLWEALAAPHAPDILVSLAPGWECVDWGGAHHAGGGSHGSLEAGDSLVPLLTVGVDAGSPPGGEQWKLCDVAGIVSSQFEPAAAAPEPALGAPR